MRDPALPALMAHVDTDSTDPWFYERTSDGWEIRDENRLLVAFVPDVEHEREDDARRIASSRCPEPPCAHPTKDRR